MVDVELAHVLFPVHMGVEQPGNDELAAEIDHLRARRHGGIGGEDVADDVSFDQQRAIPQGSIREPIDEGRASDEERRRRRLAERRRQRASKPKTETRDRRVGRAY